MGVIWVCFFIYIRIIMKRHPYKLNDLEITQEYLYIFTYIQIVFLLFHLLLIFLALSSLLNISIKKEHFFFNVLNNCVDIIFTRPLTHIRDLLSPYIPHSGNIYIKFSCFIKNNGNPRDYRFFVIIFYALPRIIVALTFFIEIVFYNQIHYFINIVIVLIIPLIWLVFINMLTNCGKRWVDEILERVIIEPLGDERSDGTHKNYNIKAPKNFGYTPEELKEIGILWNYAVDMYTLGAHYFKTYQTFLAPYVTILCSSCYIMGIVYKIYFLIY